MIKLNGEEVQIGHFPDGTLLLKDLDLLGHTLEWQYETNEEMVALYFITKHLRANGAKTLDLVMKYIPNARQDRIHGKEDVFTLKYFAEWINDLGFDTVSVLDAHSNVSLALLDRVIQLPVEPYIRQAITLSGLSPKKDRLFYPDEGSQKRYGQMVTFPHAFGYKKRRWEDGEIMGLEVMGDLPKEPFNVLIVDDICSFGGTFYHAAKKLKALGAEKIYLYVTHCEPNLFEGELLKSGLVERVFTTDSLKLTPHERVTILENQNKEEVR